MNPPSSRRAAIAVLGACACAVAGGGACVGPTRAVLAEAPALHPMTVTAVPFLAAPTGGLPGPASGRAVERARETGDRDAGKKPAAAGSTSVPDGGAGGKEGAAGGTSGVGGSAGGAIVASATTLSMVPARGGARVEMVASSVRLLGITGSFEDRSFLGHVLRINDLLPPGTAAQAYPASAYLKRARDLGALRPLSTARSGDVVIFACESGCGAAGQDGLSAGVVESADGGAARVIAYVDGAVRRCVAGAAPGAGKTALEGVAGVVDPWAVAIPAGTSPTR